MYTIGSNAKSTSRACLLSILILSIVGPAHALEVCTAADIAALDVGCGGSGTCVITQSFDVPADCVVDFGERALHISSAGALHVGSPFTLRAESLSVSPGGGIDGRGTGPSGIGAALAIEIAGDVSLQSTGTVLSYIDVSGISGGSLALSGANLALQGRLTADGTSGRGGTITVAGRRGVQVLQPVTANGADSVAGNGGMVSIATILGDLVINAAVQAKAGKPGGTAGTIDLTAQHAFELQAAGGLSARSDGPEGSGGSVAVVSQTLTTAAPIDVSGGSEGGEVELVAKGDVTIDGPIDASGRATEGYGGGIDIAAGDGATGSLVIAKELNAGGGACTIDDDCGDAGIIYLDGCTVDIRATASLMARAPGMGGEILLQARKALTIAGVINSVTTSSEGDDGENSLITPTGIQPAITGTIRPRADKSQLPLCTLPTQVACLPPCPTCGDGTIEFPEVCDSGDTASCDGCSPFCELETCGAVVPCRDTCDVTYGCAVGTPCVYTPTPTASITPVFSNTPTPTRTLPADQPTSSPTSTPTATDTATPSPTLTPTATRTSTATASPTVTCTPTPASRHDAWVKPPRPLNVRIKAGRTEASHSLRVRVYNGNVAPLDAEKIPLQLIVDDGDCPPGTVTGIPDFNRAEDVAGDVAVLAGGASATAIVPLHFDAASFPMQSPRSTMRCRLALETRVVFEGNQDPTPDNNRVLVELNVTDGNHGDMQLPEQSAVLSASPIKLRIPRGATSTTRTAIVEVRSASTRSVGYSLVRMAAFNGDCPFGTVGAIVAGSGTQPSWQMFIGSGQQRRAKVTLSVNAQNFPAALSNRPRRCTALIAAGAAPGDIEASNDTTALIIDISDANN